MESTFIAQKRKFIESIGVDIRHNNMTYDQARSNVQFGFTFTKQIMNQYWVTYLIWEKFEIDIEMEIFPRNLLRHLYPNKSIIRLF
jgi:hypothetical protein